MSCEECRQCDSSILPPFMCTMEDVCLLCLQLTQNGHCRVHCAGTGRDPRINRDYNQDEPRDSRIRNDFSSYAYEYKDYQYYNDN